MDSRSILIVDQDATSGHALVARLDKLARTIVGVASSESEAFPMMADASLAIVEVAPGEARRMAASPLLKQRACAVMLVISESDEAALLDAGLRTPNSYIVKPFNDRELRVHIELALSKLDAARAVYELEDRFFATSIDMLCFLNFNGHFKRLNPAWERTLGFTREELMSRPFIEFVHPDDRERTLNQNREVRGGGKALGFENRYLCKDGSYRWFLWNAAPDTAEQVIYSVARDVTASRLAAQEREELVRELQSALDEVKALRGILPMCSYCRRVRDDNDYWHTVENYISTHTTTLFTHGICPTCVATEIEPHLSS
ncbi:MAG TPA: PAS domain S-box protein [Gemmatimonadaceae bacterium]|jgi:PAS domain S-box-containing protein|nr:PAS domain S-box protein [Gemmatimonadaceae bacterium]